MIDGNRIIRRARHTHTRARTRTRMVFIFVRRSLEISEREHLITVVIFMD